MEPLSTLRESQFREDSSWLEALPWNSGGCLFSVEQADRVANSKAVRGKRAQMTGGVFAFTYKLLIHL